MAIDETALGVLDATPQLLRTLFAGVAAEAAEEQLDNEWSAKDTLAHLFDVEDGVIPLRIRRMIEEDRPFIASIDAPRRLFDGGYAALSVEELLDVFAKLRARQLAWLRTLTPDQLARAGDHDAAGEITASQIAHQWAYHDLMHLRQIASALQAAIIPHMGNTRKFYDV